MQQNSEEFSPMKRDAIGEIQNITMGSAATALSNLLSAKVWITTPKVETCKIGDLSFPEMEPSIHVKIDYISGVTGASLMVLKQSDVQLILSLLMGTEPIVTDDFEFDEMNISAICEVMNQMMGASATALSEIINTQIDISTPEAYISSEDHDFHKFQYGSKEDTVCKISFNLNVGDIINSEFITIMSLDLANTIADKMLAGYNAGLEDYIDDHTNAQASPPPTVATPPIATPPVATPPVATAPPPIPPAYTTPGYAQQAPAYTPPPAYAPPPEPVNVRAAQFQDFGKTDESIALSRDQIDNLKLLMNVPLNISIEIGSTHKKVEEILEFTQGTVIELDKQAGAPVDVIVNGNLIAKGDVVVIDDNFAVRITEIIKSKFLDSLGKTE